MHCIQHLLTSFWGQCKLNSVPSNPAERVHDDVAVERLTNADSNVLSYFLRSNRKPTLCKGRGRNVFSPLISRSPHLKTTNQAPHKTKGLALIPRILAKCIQPGNTGFEDDKLCSVQRFTKQTKSHWSKLICLDLNTRFVELSAEDSSLLRISPRAQLWKTFYIVITLWRK